MNTIEEITKAILKGDKYYKNVRLPSPQGAGTTIQKVSFAKMKATQIFKKHFKKKTDL